MSEEEKTEKLKEFSPVYRMRGETFFHRLSATSLLPPVNLLHGTADNTVRRGTGRRACRRGGCEKDAYCVCAWVCTNSVCVCVLPRDLFFNPAPLSSPILPLQYDCTQLLTDALLLACCSTPPFVVCVPDDNRRIY